MIRLFSTISIPEAISHRLSEIQTPFPGVRWLFPHSYHITLVFMGEVNVYLFRQIRQQFNNLDFRKFEISLKGLELFYDEHGNPTVLTAKIEQSAELLKLQKESAKHISMFHPSLKFNHAFKPHLTLAKFSNVESDSIQQLVDYHVNTEFGKFEVDSFELYSSRVTNTGSSYTKLESYKAYNSPELEHHSQIDFL